MRRVVLAVVAVLACALTACSSTGDDAGQSGATYSASSRAVATGPGTTMDASSPDDVTPALPLTLTVDGETFTITESADGGHNYSWDTGPNPDYGFSESAPMTAEMTGDETRERLSPGIHRTRSAITAAASAIFSP